MRKLHYHSDCSFFAGCEQMLGNFFESPEIKVNFEISFSYRSSERYTEGLQRRVKGELKLDPLSFPDLDSDLSFQMRGPKVVTQFCNSAIRILSIYPLFLYDVVLLHRLLMRTKPDILHVNSGGYPGALSTRAVVVAARWANIPVVLMVVNNLAVGYTRPSRWMDYPIDRWVARSVDLFITGSEAAANQLRFVLGLPKSRVKAIHNGVSVRPGSATLAETRDRLGLNKFKGVVFGVVALLIGRKGHRILLEAVAKMCDEDPAVVQEVKILIEGDGPLRAELAEFIDTHNLHDTIVLVGSEENVVDFMSALDVLILPSVQDEDFPNVILEAMSLGKPVIATRLAGTPEQVEDGVTGILVEPRNVDQLADAIKYLVRNENIRLEFGRSGLARYHNHFTQAMATANYLATYTQLAKENSDRFQRDIQGV
jgi:glycosyltransferase involved in cell wall biosynthesis